ncbi:MAG TPA: hypothetical protein DF613_11480 [Lachnospiraceae bacterium]|nr:hypothetical protein [Lachnospiraceae bacterium]
MIKTVIFDIGRVLMNYDWDGHLERLFHDKETVRAVKDALFTKGVWDELDREVWSLDQIRNGFISAAPGYRTEILTAFDRLGEAFTHRPYSKDWISGLKKRGYQVLYLSNYSTYAIEANRDVLDFLPLMDGGIFSRDVKLIKPDPAIYRALIDHYHLTPAECVFIDDTEPNVEEAARQGIHAIHFIDYEQASAELEHLLNT